jgi:hypothetical protein
MEFVKPGSKDQGREREEKGRKKGRERGDLRH